MATTSAPESGALKIESSQRSITHGRYMFALVLLILAWIDQLAQC